MIEIKAYAKVNLTLDVCGKRPDGYHELKTVMHSIPLADTLTLEFSDGDELSCTTDRSFIRNSTNLALRAAKAFYDRTGIREGLHIDIKKRIPVGAGLGGGSADAAAMLKALNDRHCSPLSLEKLCELGTELGADVPFCILGGCALCEGIGEIMTPLKTLPRCHILLVKPQVSLSTAEMFSRIDRAPKRRERPDTNGFLASLDSGDIRELAKRMFNGMESAAASSAPEIGEIKTSMLALSALGACMSGSGSSVIGLYNDRAAADSAALALQGMRREIFVLDI